MLACDGSTEDYLSLEGVSLQHRGVLSSHIHCAEAGAAQQRVRPSQALRKPYIKCYTLEMIHKQRALYRFHSL